jgi:hypothetical protein
MVTGDLPGPADRRDPRLMQTSTALRSVPKPFLPSDRDTSRSLIRACVAQALHAHLGGQRAPSAEALVVKHWAGDTVARRLVTRAATAPATTTGTGWADVLGPTNVATDFVMGLQRLSGAARLIAAGLRPTLEGISTLRIMHATSQAADEPVFVQEGSAIPVPQSAYAGTVLGPAKKLATIRVLTEEILQHSIPNIEIVVGTLLREGGARALDKAVFSATAGSALRPPGILVGVTPIAATANTGQTLNLEVVASDFQNLINPLVDAGGGRHVMIFMAPGKAIALTVTAPGLALLRDLGAEIVGVPTMPNAQLIAVEAMGFASSFGPDPTIETSIHAEIHLEDTAPADIGTVGTPNVVAAPVKSMFQTQSVALKLELPCAWAMRAPGLVQTITAVNW